MNEKNKTKKTKQAKDLNSQEKVMDTIRFIHKKKGRRDMFHLRAKVGRKWVSCGTFHPEIGWGSWSVLSRGECEGAVLQLQYQFGGESIHIRTETWREESPRVVQTQATSNKMVKYGLRVKDFTLYKIK